MELIIVLQNSINIKKKKYLIVIFLIYASFSSLFGQKVLDTISCENKSYYLLSISKERYDNVKSLNNVSQECNSCIISSSKDSKCKIEKKHMNVQINKNGLIVKTLGDETHTYLNDSTEDGDPLNLYYYIGYIDCLNSHLIQEERWEWYGHIMINSLTGEIKDLPSHIRILPEIQTIVGIQYNLEGDFSINLYRWTDNNNEMSCSWNLWYTGIKGDLDDFFVDFQSGIYIKTDFFGEQGRSLEYYNIPLN